MKIIFMVLTESLQYKDYLSKLNVLDLYNQEACIYIPSFMDSWQII